MIRKFSLVFIWYCLFSNLAFAQVQDSLQVVDTLATPEYQLDDPALDSLLEASLPDTSLEKTKKPLFFWKAHPDYPKPKTALVTALIIPGGGQFYNNQWWKMPFVYGAIGGLGYLVERNSSDYLQLKRAHRRKLRGVPHDFTDTYLDDAGNLKDLRDQADKNRQLSYVGLVAVYILSGAEAFVAAHLANFDVEEDLSFKLEPGLIDSPYGTTAGIGLKISF